MLLSVFVTGKMCDNRLIARFFMRICIYGSASDKIDDKYKKAVEELGERLAKAGHELVYGGGANGLMGATVRGFKRGGGKATGIVPHFFKQNMAEALSKQSDEIIWTNTMHERKQKMEELAEAFITVPGGVGTFDETFSVITDKQLGVHFKPVAIYNLYGFFDSFVALMNHAVKENFVNEKCLDIYKVTSDVDELIEYLKKGDEKRFVISEVKNG